MQGGSINSRDSQEYEHYLSIGLHKAGLSLEQDGGSALLSFDTLTLADKVPHNECQGTIRALGLIGAVEIGPGYLVVIQTQKPVFEHKDVTVWNIVESLVIPLKYELAKTLFKVDNSLEKIETHEIQESGHVTNAINDHINRGKDFFFSKLGVYANDLRSNPSLSLSTKKVSNILFDTDEESVKSDEIEENNLSSFKLKRSITIRGLPPNPKESSFVKFFEKSKLQQLQDMGLKSHVSPSMLRKIERQLKLFFNSGDFFYSNELDITKDLNYQDGAIAVKYPDERRNAFCFNANITKGFSRHFFIPIIQGFAGSIQLTVLQVEEKKQGQVLLISKRSTHRAGSRYLRRGIDDNGDVANFVLTSQIVIVDDIQNGAPLFAKFDIIRGSIPIFFQQNPANLKPVPYLTRPIEKCHVPFQQHFDNLKNSFNSVSCVSLVERSKKEVVVGDAYERLCEEYGVKFCWFDFHEVCKKMKFDNVVHLLDSVLQNGDDSSVQDRLIQSGWFDSINGSRQTGIFRINCVDCLDRTNLVQKFLSEMLLRGHILARYNLQTQQEFQKQFNNLWADNGDYISRQYASTDALKGDYTRTSKRNYKGLLNDAFLTMSRYYSGYISDYFKQCFIDYLLGHSNEDVFEEFESTLNVLDPNQVIEDLNKKNFQLERILEQLEIPDDLIVVGSWSGFSSPLEYDALKTNGELALISMFLTNKIIYLIQFDEKAGVITRSIMIPVDDVKGLEYGTYILSAHNALSKNPRKNIGLKFILPVKTMPVFEATESVDPTSKFITVKFPHDMEYSKVKYIINLISKTCHSSALESKDIMTEKEASTNMITMMEYKFKKLVWG
jgi:hypothetical protein